jgi:ATP-binding cassette, subfamily G (WHITE), member 2, SNQ2
MFDKVLVIDQGRCVYFGPGHRAKSYFEELGFECAPRQTTADFLTAVTDPHGRVVKEGCEVPRTPEDFERAFHDKEGSKSSSSSEIKNTITRPSADHGVYTISFYKQVQACAIRQFQVLWGDKMTFFGKFILTVFVSLVLGSLFYNQPTTSSGVFTRGGVILYSFLAVC